MSKFENQSQYPMKKKARNWFDSKMNLFKKKTSDKRVK
jgi:hypothetical protein